MLCCWMYTLVYPFLDGSLAASYKDLASHQALVIRNLPASAGDARDVGLIPGLGRSPEKGMAIHSSILPRKFHGQTNLLGYGPWGLKGSDVTVHIHKHSL